MHFIYGFLFAKIFWSGRFESKLHHYQKSTIFNAKFTHLWCKFNALFDSDKKVVRFCKIIPTENFSSNKSKEWKYTYPGYFHLIKLKEGWSVGLQLLLPELYTLIQVLPTTILCRQDVNINLLDQGVHTRVSLEAFADFVGKQWFCKGENNAHGPGQVHEVDFLVAHGKGALTAGEGLGHLTWGPDRDLVPGYSLLIQDVGKSANLKKNVLLVKNAWILNISSLKAHNF